jgi:hypothetical protein
MCLLRDTDCIFRYNLLYIIIIIIIIIIVIVVPRVKRIKFSELLLHLHKIAVCV